MSGGLFRCGPIPVEIIIEKTGFERMDTTILSRENKEIKIQSQKKYLETSPNKNAQIAKYIRHIFQDKNGNFWFGTNRFGVAHFDGHSISYYSTKQGIEGRQITGITEDAEKNIWFATNHGVVIYDWSTTKNGEKSFINYPVEGYLRTQCWSILSDSKGNIWAGTEYGVKHFNGTIWKTFELPYSDKNEDSGLLTDVRIFSLLEDSKGNFWFGTDGNGVIKYNPSFHSTNDQSFIQYTEKNGLDGQKHVKLITINTISKAKYLEQEIEKYLNIIDREVPEGIK